MKSPFLLAVTPAMVLLMPLFAPYVSLRHKFLYHLDGSAPNVLLACLINIAAVWALLAAVLWLAERFTLLRVAFWSLFLSSLPWRLGHGIAALAGTGMPGVLNGLLALLFPLGLGLAALLYRRRSPLQRQRVYGKLCEITALVSLSWLLTLGQFGYYALAMRGVNDVVLHSMDVARDRSVVPKNGTPPRPRVIWLIFDELGYDQTFARRPSDLQLPAFDALARESTVFTKAVAPGIFTEQVIPALILGQPAQNVYFTPYGSLRYQNDAKSRWVSFDAENTVFGDALRAGDATGVVGWHNPYCRLLAPVLDRCFWSSRSDSTTTFADGRSTLRENILAPGRRFLLGLEHPEMVTQAAEGRRAADLHIADLKALTAAADRLLADPTMDFVMIHLPIPHPTGIYDRRRTELTDKGHVSYEDNLALADRLLASFREILIARNAWDSATVVLMGDHAWRTKLIWQNSAEWTAEDQAASHGGAFDPRPVYMVKLANQHVGQQIGESFETLRTRALLDEVLGQRLQTPDDLQRWAAH